MVSEVGCPVAVDPAVVVPEAWVEWMVAAVPAVAASVA